MAYVELHAHSAYSFLDGASQPEELAARAAELGYEALALTDHDGVYGSLEFAHAAKAFGLRAITGAEVTLEGGAHVTLLVETPQGLREPLPAADQAHAGTRPKPGNEPPLPPALPLQSLLELNEGLVCLSGCARHGLGVYRPNDAAQLASALRSRPLLRRAPAAVRARRHAPPRAAAGARPRPRRRDRRDRRRPCSPPAPRRAPGRARRDPLPHLARRLRAGAARQPRVGAAPAGRRARPLPRRPRRRPPHGRDRLRSHFRPDAGARLPLPGLLRWVRDARRPAQNRL